MLAVELFETTDERLLVNELAMRPHNSGHWSQDGAVTGQFEQHVRAVLDLPLGDPLRGSRGRSWSTSSAAPRPIRWRAAFRPRSPRTPR
jgi:phosphoribosylaminoimidazole carboxylase (NCAIR synthetase)